MGDPLGGLWAVAQHETLEVDPSEELHHVVQASVLADAEIVDADRMR